MSCSWNFLVKKGEFFISESITILIIRTTYVILILTLILLLYQNPTNNVYKLRLGKLGRLS